jgi:uncharacterized protein (TIGR02678 family)
MNDFAENLAAERKTAIRLLLKTPLITADAEEFPLIRRHADDLARQFAQVLGYRLTVEPGFARLHKVGLGRNASRRLERTSGTPFTPRTYAYLTLALAALVTAPEQLLLSEVVARTRAAAAEAGLDLDDPNRVGERRALVAALKQLMTWHVLTEDEGEVDSYAADEEADALLTINREIARRLVTGPVSPATTPDDLIEKAAEPAEDGPRHRVRRLLIEQPVVYADDLSDDDRDWLRRSQRREQRVLEDFAGLRAEIRAEGVALIDPGQDLTDTQFPGTGTVAWAALLLIGRLPGREPVTDDQLSQHLAELIEEHRKAWSQALTASPGLLLDAVLDLLTRMRLMRKTEGEWRLTPAAARYAPEVTR